MPRPPRPAGGGQPAVAVVDEVGQQLAVCRSRTTVPSGTGTSQVGAALAVVVLALAVGAVAGPAVRVVAEGQQRGHVAVGDQPDVAALAAVAAVGPPMTSGPSRRKQTQPAPPSPPRTLSWHSSTNPTMAARTRLPVRPEQVRRPAETL